MRKFSKFSLNRIYLSRGLELKTGENVFFFKMIFLVDSVLKSKDKQCHLLQAVTEGSTAPKIWPTLPGTPRKGAVFYINPLCESRQETV